MCNYPIILDEKDDLTDLSVLNHHLKTKLDTQLS